MPLAAGCGQPLHAYTPRPAVQVGLRPAPPAIPANVNDFRISAAGGCVAPPWASLEPARRRSADCEPEVEACA
jgi:hypothetical protein